MAEPRYFSGYQLLRRITQGGTGDVYLARREDDPFEEPVVLRRIYPGAAPQVVRDVLEEAIFAAQLSHPNMINVREMGEAEGMLYFVLDYVHGASLRALVAGWRVVEPSRSFPWAPLCRAAISLCEALEYCHTLVDAQGQPSRMTHQGLSPRSVMLGTNGAVKLVDFGRARSVMRALAEGVAPGGLPAQPEYAAPEQVKGHAADARTDVYGLSLTLYTALTGAQPFEAGGGTDSVAHAVLRREVPPLKERRPDVPRAMREAIHDGLHRDPDRRPQSMSELRDRLWDALFDEKQVVGLPELGALVTQVFSLIDG
ncbi:MAG TPA: serine/threonine-protein kinase [Myxococcales bacterium]|nr:serine/threonine-protein kinase [Myxococcales bacterium]